MGTIKEAAKNAIQPKGGYTSLDQFQKIQIDDGGMLFPSENINAGLIGTTVDYLTRFMYDGNRREAFKVSLLGAKNIGQVSKAESYLYKIQGLDNYSIEYACKLTGYDICYRGNIFYYRPIDEIIPDANTMANIRLMVQRTQAFLGEYGPIKSYGCVLQDKEKSLQGDIDLLTQDTIWDIKTSKKPPNPVERLQVIIYYLVAEHIKKRGFSKVENVGIFNPRLNTIYRLKISDLPPQVLNEIKTNVLKYTI